MLHTRRAMAIALLLALVVPAFAAGEPSRDARSLGRTTGDVEVEDVTLAAVPVVMSRVRGATAEVTLIVRAGFGELLAKAARAGISPAGPPMTVFLSIGDADFEADLMLPVAAVPAPLPDGLRAGASPEGRAVRMVHAGPHEELDESYEQFATFLEDRGIAVKDTVIERYLNDPRTTAGNDLLTELYVLVQ
jgi:effector-binding domain-containing protein